MLIREEPLPDALVTLCADVVALSPPEQVRHAPLLVLGVSDEHHCHCHLACGRRAVGRTVLDRVGVALPDGTEEVSS